MQGESRPPLPMSPREIQRRVDELGPWVNPFEFKGVQYFDRGDRPAGMRKASVRGRHTKAFYDVFPDARTILELGALEGGDTVPLASRPGVEILAIEGREENLRRAEFVAELHGLDNIRFVLADIEMTDLSQFGRFDAVVCAGILYHVQKPWELLVALAQITNKMFLWTHYWGDESIAVRRGNYLVHEVTEEFPEPRLRGLRPYSLWFCYSSLFEALGNSGFADVEILEESGIAPIRDITLVARKIGI